MSWSLSFHISINFSSFFLTLLDIQKNMGEHDDHEAVKPVLWFENPFYSSLKLTLMFEATYESYVWITVCIRAFWNGHLYEWTKSWSKWPKRINIYSERKVLRLSKCLQICGDYGAWCYSFSFFYSKLKKKIKEGLSNWKKRTIMSLKKIKGVS